MPFNKETNPIFFLLWFSASSLGLFSVCCPFFKIVIYRKTLEPLSEDPPPYRSIGLLEAKNFWIKRNHGSCDALENICCLYLHTNLAQSYWHSFQNYSLLIFSSSAYTKFDMLAVSVIPLLQYDKQTVAWMQREVTQCRLLLFGSGKTETVFK